MVRIPQISSLETAIRIYYERTQLTNSDIRQLFGAKAGTTIAKLKEAAREVMRQENAPIWNAPRAPPPSSTRPSMKFASFRRSSAAPYRFKSRAALS